MSDAGKYRCIAQVTDHEQNSTEAMLEVVPGWLLFDFLSLRHLIIPLVLTFHIGLTFKRVYMHIIGNCVSGTTNSKSYNVAKVSLEISDGHGPMALEYHCLRIRI